MIVYSGDGYLSVFDVRRPDIVARSDNLEDELLSLALVKVYSLVSICLVITANY